MKFRKWFVIATLVFSCSFKVLAYEKELAIFSIFRNEGPWLKEWIEFHKLQGVEHFYLYNNLSTDSFEAVLDEYVKRGEVTLIQWAETGPNWHVHAINHSIAMTVGRVKWLAVIDTDEFLFSPKGLDLREYLKRFERRPDVGGVCVNWQLFGTSGVKSLNKGELLIEKLLLKCTRYSGANAHIKTIIRPKMANNPVQAHSFNYIKKCFAVDSNFKFIDGPYNYDVPIDDIRINHYFHRTLDWAYGEKLERVQQNWSKKVALSKIEKREKNCSVEKDTAILIYAERLRKAMGF